MSVFPVVVREGVFLYHGSYTADIPPSFEWTAFEVEHAEAFARPRPQQQKPPSSPTTTPIVSQTHQHLGAGLRVQSGHSEDASLLQPFVEPDEPISHGYLHIYQTTRPLHVLYIDGMSAGKTTMGTCDMQDFLLRGDRNDTAFDEWKRAAELCEMVKGWGLDAIMRMEAGFELITCNFTNGLQRVAVNRVGPIDSPVNMDEDHRAFEYMRAASKRYDGLGGARAVVDFSSMVSPLFYPVNVTNPKAEVAELPRLVETAPAELEEIRLHFENLLTRRKSNITDTIDWQGVTDMIVTRYADRLAYMAEIDNVADMRAVVNNFVNVVIDYEEEPIDVQGAISWCAHHYLEQVTPKTPEDHLVHAGLESVTTEICSSLFRVRSLVAKELDGERSVIALRASRYIVKELMDKLQWVRWKECGMCKPSEVCFTAMWPWGDAESHYNPQCVNRTALVRHMEGNDYWEMPRWRGRRPKSAKLLWETTEAFRGESLDALGQIKW